MKAYIEAQKRLKLQAPVHSMFYSNGCAFTLDRSIVIIPTITREETISYNLYKNNGCINSSTDLEYIFSLALKEFCTVGALKNARFVLLQDIVTNQIKLLPILILEKGADGTFNAAPDYTYSFDASGGGKRTGSKVLSLFVSISSAFDYLCLNYQRAELIFSPKEEPIKVFLGDCRVDVDCIMTKDALTEEFVKLPKVHHTILHNDHQLTQVNVNP